MQPINFLTSGIYIQNLLPFNLYYHGGDNQKRTHFWKDWSWLQIWIVNCHINIVSCLSGAHCPSVSPPLCLSVSLSFSAWYKLRDICRRALCKYISLLGPKLTYTHHTHTSRHTTCDTWNIHIEHIKIHMQATVRCIYVSHRDWHTHTQTHTQAHTGGPQRHSHTLKVKQ